MAESKPSPASTAMVIWSRVSAQFERDRLAALLAAAVQQQFGQEVADDRDDDGDEPASGLPVERM